MIGQYYKLIAPRKKLVDKISNVWLFLFIAIEAGAAFSIANLLGFSVEELSTVTKDTENGTLLGILILSAVPFTAWLAWGLSSLPFVALGDMKFNELKLIVFKFRYPEYWIDSNV